MPIPTDKQEVMQFCGVINYLNDFCTNVYHVIKPSSTSQSKTNNSFGQMSMKRLSEKQSSSSLPHRFDPTSMSTKQSFKWMHRKMVLELPCLKLMTLIISSQLPTSPVNYGQMESCGLRLRKNGSHCGSPQQMGPVDLWP